MISICSADIVTLLCLQNAKEGGHSSWASSITVYNEILKRRPDLAKLLAGPWYFDRKGEVPQGKQGFFEIPVLNFHVSVLPPWIMFTCLLLNHSKLYTDTDRYIEPWARVHGGRCLTHWPYLREIVKLQGKKDGIKQGYPMSLWHDVKNCYFPQCQTPSRSQASSQLLNIHCMGYGTIDMGNVGMWGHRFGEGNGRWWAFYLKTWGSLWGW
jgi:hypothetical protein